MSPNNIVLDGGTVAREVPCHLWLVKFLAISNVFTFEHPACAPVTINGLVRSLGSMLVTGGNGRLSVHHEFPLPYLLRERRVSFPTAFSYCYPAYRENPWRRSLALKLQFQCYSRGAHLSPRT